MKIYFACSITGGREDENIYQHLVEVILLLGGEVPSAHITNTGIEETDGKAAPSDIYLRDITWIGESDMLIAEISTPSHGVGYEIGFALNMNKPVLCLYKEKIAVSKMITGNPHPLLTILSYKDKNDAENLLRKYLSEARNTLDGRLRG